MKKRAYLSPQAEADLSQIWLHVAQDSTRVADRLIRRIQHTCELLAANPHMGRRRDDLRPEIRSFPCGRYVIFYRETDDGIGVARVLSGHRDIDSIFG